MSKPENLHCIAQQADLPPPPTLYVPVTLWGQIHSIQCDAFENSNHPHIVPGMANYINILLS